MTIDLQGMLEKDESVTLRKNYRTTDNDDIYEEINKLYKQNVSASDIASRLGVSSSSVDRRLHKMGYVTGSTTYMLNMKEFILDVVANKSVIDLSYKYGISKTTVSDIKYACGLTELGLKLKLRSGEVSPQDIINGNEFLKSIDSNLSGYSNNKINTSDKMTEEKKNQAVNLYKKGFTISEIKKSLHISHKTLYKALKEQSVDTRTKATDGTSSVANPYIRDIINARLELLVGYKQINERLNLPISKSTVYSVLKQANLSNKNELEQAIADNVTVDDLVDSNNNIIPFNKNKDYGKNRPNKKVNVEPVKPEPDHNVDNRYVSQLQSHEPDQVPGFWKRLKYAFSANTNDLKD